MIPGHALERIVIVPVNGYANRLQAWASASALGADLDVPVQVLWEPEPIAAASGADLFDAALVAASFINTEEVVTLLDAPHPSLPRYLVDAGRSGDALMLAGHDRGEQAFMGDLAARLAQGRHRALVIVAGGHFHLPGVGDPQARRRAFYQGLRWSKEVSRRTDAAMPEGSFIGLHVRGTDRSVTAPIENQLRKSVLDVAARTGASAVYLAADTREARERWATVCDSLGLDPRSLPAPDLNRGCREAGIDALADWRVLGTSRGLAYSLDSSFGAEAAVAAGSDAVCVGVRATPLRQWTRSLRAFALGPFRARQRPSASTSHASMADS